MHLWGLTIKQLQPVAYRMTSALRLRSIVDLDLRAVRLIS